MNPSGACRESSRRLQIAWNEVTTALLRFTSILRSMDGCEHVIVTVCVRNGSRVDAYSLPAGTLNNRDEVAGEHDRLAEKSEIGDQDDTEMVCTLSTDDNTTPGTFLTRDTSHKESLQEISDYLQDLSNQQVRTFLTDVRKRLKLKTFHWPEDARKRFVTELKAPVPSVPGRINSGKSALLHMLRFSAETDSAWRSSVYETWDGLQTSCLLNEDRDACHDLSHETTDDTDVEEHSEGLSECLDNSQSDVELPKMESCESLTNNGSDEDIPAHILEVVSTAPSDSMKVRIPTHAWVSLSKLLSTVRHPLIDHTVDWFVQPIPGDGNCMFSAILVAAKLRGCLPASLDSVRKLRTRLRKELIDFSRAGNFCSKYRRDWLASCVYEVDDTVFQRYCQTYLEKASASYRDSDMEGLLAPLRIMVSNWADKVGGDHWGGLLRIELCIIASMLGVVIEVMQPVGTSHALSDPKTVITVCDTRMKNDLTRLERRDLIYPHSSALPSVDQRFLGPIGSADSSGGWVGLYPVLRVLLNDRHYNACTSRYSYAIAPEEKQTTMSPGNPYFNESDTLVEPFSSLTKEEENYHMRAMQMIHHWREASHISPESGKHADSIVMQSKCTTLTVSMLCHLNNPVSISILDERYLISDEIVTCYMHLLQRRTDGLRRHQNMNGFVAPPRSIYMDSWFFKSIWRGLSGPSWKRKRIDLRDFNTILIPALVNGHWALAICYVEESIIGVYDPFNVPRQDIFSVIRNWIESQLPGGDNKTWRYVKIEETRGCKQIGCVDCGIYVCKAAESLGLGLPVRISQTDICYVRKRMMVELMRQEATKISWSRRALR